MKYILYGVVRDKSFRHITESYIRNSNGEILFYVDDAILDDDESITQLFDGKAIPVYSTKRISDYPEAIIVILAAKAFHLIYESLKSKKIYNSVYMAPVLGWRFIIDDYCEPKTLNKLITGWIKDNENELCSIYNVKDERTRLILDEIVKERREYNLVPIEDYEYFGYEDYFDDSIVTPRGDFIFVDCGVYIGDTIENICDKYGERIRRVIGYEPNDENIRKARHLIKSLGVSGKVKLIKKGLWSHETQLGFDVVGDEINFSTTGNHALPVVSLDESCVRLIEDFNEKCLEESIDICVKMDLEGSEIQAIYGSTEFIRKYHPYMAICLYHKMTDILEVPRVIKDICSDYVFYLRAGTHTELYAVPL